MKLPFKDPKYIGLSLVTFLGVMVLSIWLPNISFIKHTVVSSDLNLNQKLGILGASLEAIQTNFTLLSQVLTITVAFLFAVNLSLTIFYLRGQFALKKALGTNFFAVIFGLLGVGCASCGSVILTSILGLTAATSFIALLPFKGAEFGLVSIGILFFSLILLVRKINDPQMCEVKK